ncbi:DUF1661 domain-containing protein [Porphyromonas gingivalis]|uniref:DUF1661 domain-containing protein n=1 Tax=Porphyromonas gingivalis TaxID=837 RepID=UPI00333FADCB
MARKIFASRTKTKKFSRHLFSVHVTAEKNFSWPERSFLFIACCILCFWDYSDYDIFAPDWIHPDFREHRRFSLFRFIVNKDAVEKIFSPSSQPLCTQLNRGSVLGVDNSVAPWSAFV